jgi:hypothetical protein
VWPNSFVTQDRCEPGSRFRKCKIRVTIGATCDHGACGADPLRIDARHSTSAFTSPTVYLSVCQARFVSSPRDLSHSMHLRSGFQTQDRKLLATSQSFQRRRSVQVERSWQSDTDATRFGIITTPMSNPKRFRPATWFTSFLKIDSCKVFLQIYVDQGD